MDDVEIYIDTEHIKDYLYERLLEKGHIPNRKILDELAHIFFDYLMDMELIDEIDEIED